MLGFHAAWRPDGLGGRSPAVDQTQRMMQVYPASVRRWISRQGGLTSGDESSSTAARSMRSSGTAGRRSRPGSDRSKSLGQAPLNADRCGRSATGDHPARRLALDHDGARRRGRATNTTDVFRSFRGGAVLSKAAWTISSYGRPISAATISACSSSSSDRPWAATIASSSVGASCRTRRRPCAGLPGLIVVFAHESNLFRRGSSRAAL